MIAHDPTLLPLADSYEATENSHPSALSIMNCWRTITGINCVGQCMIDKPAGQILVTASVDESGMPSVFYGRLKIKNDLIAELELYINRSRGDSGFIFLPNKMNELPSGWTSPIPQDGRATREELVALCRALFDTSGPIQYEASPDCILMELGGIVYEDPDYLDTMQNEGKKSDSKELVTIPAGLWPVRPCDPNARVEVIDEEQGIVAGFATVHGYVCPYIVPHETGSCFVPDSMIELHRKTITPELMNGKKAIKEMPATAASVDIVRFHSGKVQGMHRLTTLEGLGSESYWVKR
jgi:hypothetical protein